MLGALPAILVGSVDFSSPVVDFSNEATEIEYPLDSVASLRLRTSEPALLQVVVRCSTSDMTGVSDVVILGDDVPIGRIPSQTNPADAVPFIYIRVPGGVHVLEVDSSGAPQGCTVSLQTVETTPEGALVLLFPEGSEQSPEPALGQSEDSGHFQPVQAFWEFLGITPELPRVGPSLGLVVPWRGSRPSASVGIEMRPSLDRRWISLRSEIRWYRIPVKEQLEFTLPIGGEATLDVEWHTDVIPIETGLLVHLPSLVDNLEPWVSAGLGAYLVRRNESGVISQGTAIGPWIALGADVPVSTGSLVVFGSWNNARKRFDHVNESGDIARESLSSFRLGFSWTRKY